MSYGDQELPTREEFELRQQIRNETIDELCTWLHSCIENVDHSSEVYKACTAMVNAMQGKKTQTGAQVDPHATHYPLSHRP
jgi:hypothetical protein